MANTLLHSLNGEESVDLTPAYVADLPPPAPQLSYVATAEKLELWASRIQDLRKRVQDLAREPNTFRTFRALRMDEAAAFSGLSERVCADWATAHRQATGKRVRGRGLEVASMHQLMEERGVRPRRPEGKRALRLLVSNFKGGAQKTTLSLHLAHYLGLRGYRVLVVDTDPQGTLTQYMGFRPSQVPNPNTVGVAYEFESAEDLAIAPVFAPIKTHIDGVDLLPANLDMTSLDFQVSRLFVQYPELARHFPDRLHAAFQGVEENYDLILIDSPPAFSFLAIAMSWVADSLIVPMPTASGDFAGTGDFCEMLASYTKIVQEWYQDTKQWAPSVFVHARVAGGSGSDLVHANSGMAFEHQRLVEMVPESRPIANCLGVFKSVFESTSKDTDLKGLVKAQDAYFTLCAKIESLFAEGWDVLREVCHG